MLSCEIVRDLLPLYADNICSEASRKEVEEHIKTCDSCKAELELFTNFDEMETDVDEKAAFQNFNKKMMKSNVKKIIIATVAAVAVIAMACVGMYVPTKTVKWSDNLVTVSMPEDGGLDIRINTRDYKNAYATYALDENGDAAVYLMVEQNVLSAFVTKCDESENIVRIANDICVSYHNADNELQFYLPENTTVKEIYYVQANQNTLQEFAEGNASGTDLHLVWSK